MQRIRVEEAVVFGTANIEEGVYEMFVGRCDFGRSLMERASVLH